MPQYMLSVHIIDDEVPRPMTSDEMALQMKRIGELEDAMRADGTWLFSARMHGPDTATVVRTVDGRRIVSDGPFAESKEHLGGFYIIEAADLDEALDWAGRTSDAVGRPIQVWPFADTAGP